MIGRSLARSPPYVTEKFETRNEIDGVRRTRRANATNVMKDTTMRQLQIFATAAALLVVASAPSLAASRTHRTSDVYTNGAGMTDAYASGAVTTDRSGSYYYGPQDAQGRALAVPSQVEPSQYNQYNRGQGLPYSDRPYGAPDGW